MSHQNSEAAASAIIATDDLIRDLEECIRLAASVTAKLRTSGAVTPEDRVDLGELHRGAMEKMELARSLMSELPVPEELRRRFDAALEEAHLAFARLTEAERG
jgi:hypothetical protein